MNEPSLELWGGLECTVNRVSDTYFSQLDRNGHAAREDDLERFASLGIRAIRYPVLWERIAPAGLDQADWSWPDERLLGLQKLGVTPIVGLLHHGSGPRHTSLLDSGFAEQLSEYAGAVARRYPWVEYYTPVNEPLTTARFSGLYGIWYPHKIEERTFIQALINQCKGVVLSMRAIREVNPNAKLVQTDDIGKSFSTPALAELAEFYNHRRWLSWDLLCGKVDRDHALWDYLAASGVEEKEILWFVDNPCPPDIIGLNYYITSERWLDERTDNYPEQFQYTYRGQTYVDIHTPLVLANSISGIGPLLEEAWDRYKLPLAITEAHIDANREDQLRWLLEIWKGAQQARAHGADVRAVTVWALLGSFDWNCLVTACKGYYEPGPFDVRSPLPRPTAVATLMRELSAGRPHSSPVLHGQGWWRRKGRFICPPVTPRHVNPSISVMKDHAEEKTVEPILVIGTNGTITNAFALICAQRNLAYKVLGREELDINNSLSIEHAITKYRPWAIVNAGRTMSLNDAERDPGKCYLENTEGPATLAVTCAIHNIQLLTFSSDMVFDGMQQRPYVESDAVSPLNVYGKSKVVAERKILNTCPSALVIRTSSCFGPWDNYNFVTQALHRLASGSSFTAAEDITFSPTYLPDLVHVSLDLLIDRETGVWHLTNGEAITWANLILRACEAAEIDPSRLEIVSSSKSDLLAALPLYSALQSERGNMLPKLDDALARFLKLYKAAEVADETRRASVS